MSMRIRSGRCSAAIDTPVAPSVASMTSYPAALRRSRRICRLSSVSSMTRMRLLIYVPPRLRRSCGFPWLLDTYRQDDMEGRARAKLRGDRNRSAMHLDDAAGDRETETGAALSARARHVDLLELLEDARLVGLGDAGPRVVHVDFELSVGGRCDDLDLSMIGEFDGIPHDI